MLNGAEKKETEGYQESLHIYWLFCVLLHSIRHNKVLNKFSSFFLVSQPVKYIFTLDFKKGGGYGILKNWLNDVTWLSFVAARSWVQITTWCTDIKDLILDRSAASNISACMLCCAIEALHNAVILVINCVVLI